VEAIIKYFMSVWTTGRHVYVPEKDTSKEAKCYRSAAIINRDGWYNVELTEYPTYYKSQFHMKCIL
jgi:hypothetical protein